MSTSSGQQMHLLQCLNSWTTTRSFNSFTKGLHDYNYVDL